MEPKQLAEQTLLSRLWVWLYKWCMKKPKQQNESELHVCHKWAEVERGCGNKLSVLGGVCVCVCVRELALCSASFACVCSLCLHLANMQRATGQRQEQKRGHGGRGSALCCRLISRQSFRFCCC